MDCMYGVNRIPSDAHWAICIWITCMYVEYNPYLIPCSPP